MLQIKNIKKTYFTGDLTQIALNDVSFNLRDNEFVAVLGHSGSGKTTLLNIIGGLDRYDSGDLIINGISTKKYKDRDWDSYRNHSVGFVFQSYNLIPHQSILSNVELALTISGISSSERKERAKQALSEVGLKDHVHKRPNQLSGGQMQRVAIARALVNDPDILLADEPTGALDSETSVQVMDLLKEVAKDRLVVMVTHNGELADAYANRIIRLHDGNITGDSNPFEVDEGALKEPEHKNMGKASMSFLTSLSLSFNNLWTKKWRTFLTAFAGSIGIIGIALILSLSTGVNDYIDAIQKDTMTSYPITIEAQSMDLSSIMENAGPAGGGGASDEKAKHKLDGVYSNSDGLERASSFQSSIKENNLTKFKTYLEKSNSKISDYVGENGIVYSYDTKFDAYAYDTDGTLINTDGTEFTEESESADTSGNGVTAHFDGGGMSNGGGMGNGGVMSASSSSSANSNFSELIPGTEGELVSKAVTDNYDVLHGSWPKAYDEVVVALDENNEISTSALYELGLLPSTEYKELLEKIDKGEEVELETQKWNYEDLMKQTFRVVLGSDYYVENAQGNFDDVSEDETKVQELVDKGLELKIVGVVKPVEDASATSISSTIGYTQALTDYLIEETDKSAVVKAQVASPETNVLNGVSFEPKDDAAKVADTKEYLSNLGVSEKASLSRVILQSTYADNQEMLGQMMNQSEEQLAASLDEYLQDPDAETLLEIYDNYISSGDYEDNLSDFGVVSLEAPSAISIYSDSFEDKNAISDAIDAYNKDVEEADKITYTDYVGLLMSSVTTIVNVITYVLVAFVAVSLVVSSLMIGIITYISVLERTKEIGILRAIGASKRNISQVFNAETFIEGLISGLLGVGVTYLLLIPGNAIIHSLVGETVNAALPVPYAIALVVLSMLLTLIAGLIPAKQAAKKDPVIALRTE